jgi:hypothetical protein
MTDSTRATAIHRRHARHPNHYTWFILFSALDIMLTHTILGQFGAFGGRELNSIADWVIQQLGLWGAIGLKFATVIVVIAVCEVVAHMKPVTGLKLAHTVVVLSVFPVAWELGLLGWFAVHGA